MVAPVWTLSMNTAPFCFAGRLVIGAQPRALAARLVGEQAAVAADHQRLGGQRAQDAGLAGARDGDALQQRMVPDRVRRLAMHRLPRHGALVRGRWP